tara:strand:+ start:4171 stop:4899 length:729 start_codon:yes stop_codon:yes gene_type:complete
MKKNKVLETDINEITIDELTKLLLSSNNLSVAVCNANSVVRSYRNQNIKKILNSFDVCTPDGFPVAMGSRILYKNNQKRVDGYKIFNNTLEKSVGTKTTHYFFGNTEEVVNKIIDKYKDRNINISGYQCPPMLEVNELLNEKYIKEIEENKPDIVWISLGFPKQELFMYELIKNTQITSNLVGVGFTFDWTAGTKVKAPEYLANLGLEWIFRLIQEPRRLIRRYLVDNFLFLIYFSKQYLRL